MPTRRIFDLVIISSLALHVVWGALVKPWAARWATQEDHPLKNLTGEALVRAA